MLYQLAENLGIWDVDSLRWRMPYSQFRGWMDYYAWKRDEREKAKARDKAVGDVRRRAANQPLP